MNNHLVYDDRNLQTAWYRGGWLWLWALVLWVSPIVGCGGSSYAPVSGVVRLDSQPLADAKLIFEPIGDADGNTGGSPSYGRTDAQGRYSLKSPVANQAGAALGKHRVRILTTTAPVYTDAQIAHAREFLRKQEGNPDAKLTEEQIRNYLSDTVVVQSNETLPAKYNAATELTFEVPAGGTEGADFDLEAK
ncbi:MAG: hypothetical protein WDZ51_17900 [Pirellulaceae bacterium]